MLVFIVYILKPCIYNYERYKIRENLMFPENIRNIYLRTCLVKNYISKI